MRKITITMLATGLLLLAGALASTLGVAAQDESDTLADHPLTGTWLVMANPPLPEDPQVAGPSHFGADGSVMLMFPLAQAGPQGVQFDSAYVGTWEADGERRGHFTAVQTISDAQGTFLGSVTVDGYPVVSEDGQTFVDDKSKLMVTIRDAAGSIVQRLPGAGRSPDHGDPYGPRSGRLPRVLAGGGQPISVFASETGLTIRTDDGTTATVRDADGEVTLELFAGDGVVVGTPMQVGAPSS